jgi:hypothetical protein
MHRTVTSGCGPEAENEFFLVRKHSKAKVFVPSFRSKLAMYGSVS